MGFTYPKLFTHFVLVFGFLSIGIESLSSDNENIKRSVEISGCPFVNVNQLLLKYICLMPDYQFNEPPKNEHGEANIDFALILLKVLEINEKKNKITVQIVQGMEWEDPRIKSNFSLMSNMLDDCGYSKLSPLAAERVWHPNLDILTDDLQDWKSTYDPLWFQSLGIHKCTLFRNSTFNRNVTKLFARKHWRATLFCQFEFSSFPMDTQHCKFRQRFGATADIVRSFIKHPFNDTEKINDWKFQADGYEITITHVGSPVDENTIEQNATRDFGFDILLERILYPYLFQYYFPCTAIVLVSQISFIIPLSAIPGRVVLIVTQFLTLTNIFIHQMVSKHDL